LLFEHRAWLERELAKPPKTFHLGLQRDDVVWIGGLALPMPALPSLELWYREQARTEITRVVELEARRLGVTYTRLTIRDQSTRCYRDVMREVLRRMGLADVDALGRSLPDWPVFADAPAALREARGRGWRLAILSNTDRDFIEASMASIGVPFEFAIVASEIG